MNLENEILSVLQSYKKETIKTFPTEIRFLKALIDGRNNYSKEYCQEYLVWLNTLLLSPFDLSFIINCDTILLFISEFHKFYGTNKKTNKLLTVCISTFFSTFFRVKSEKTDEYLCCMYNLVKSDLLPLLNTNNSDFPVFRKDYKLLEELSKNITQTTSTNNYDYISRNRTPLDSKIMVKNICESNKVQSTNFEESCLNIHGIQPSIKTPTAKKFENILISSLIDVFYLYFNPKTCEIDPLADIITLQTVCQLSKKLIPLFLKNYWLFSNCEVVHKRYILKILSFQKPTKEILEFFYSFLAEKNSTVGWTVSKCIARYILHFDVEKALHFTKFLPAVYTNESVYINCAHILGMLNLKGYNLGISKCIGQSMLFYDVKSEYRSRIVREAGLFLLWTVYSTPRSVFDKNDVEEILNQLFLVALLDDEINCRRASVNVIFEIMGCIRHPLGAQILDVINIQTVFRSSLCLEAARKLKKIVDTFEGALTKHLESIFYKHSTFQLLEEYFELYSTKLDKCICSWPRFSKKLTSELFYSLCRLIKYFRGVFCPMCPMSYFGNFIKTFTISEVHSHCKFRWFVDAYLDSFVRFSHWESDFLENNLLFILDKDVSPHKISKQLDKLRSQTFDHKLVSYVAKKSNESFILSFSRFFNQHMGVKSKYMNILEGNDSMKKSYVYKALGNNCLFLNEKDLKMLYFRNIHRLYLSKTKNESCMPICSKLQFFEGFVHKCANKNILNSISEIPINLTNGENHATISSLNSSVSTMNPNTHQNAENQENVSIIGRCVLNSLEDYSANYLGDVGAFSRIEALKFLLQQQIYSVAEAYFIQYFCDRSCKIEKEIRSILNTWLESENNFPFKDSQKFFEEYLNSTNLKTAIDVGLDEEMHFKYCFLKMHLLPIYLQNHLAIGILSLLRNSDSYARNYILKYLNEKEEMIFEFLSRFLQMQGRYRFLALFAVASLFEKYEYLKRKHRSHIIDIVSDLDRTTVTIQSSKIIDALKSDRKIFDYGSYLCYK